MLTSQIDVSLNQYLAQDRRGNQNIDITCLSRRPTGEFPCLNGIHQFRLSLIILILCITSKGEYDCRTGFSGECCHTLGAKEGQTGCAHLFFIVVLSSCLVIKIFDRSQLCVALAPMCVTDKLAEVSAQDDFGFSLGLWVGRAITSLRRTSQLPSVMPAVSSDCRALAPASRLDTELDGLVGFFGRWR